MVLKKSNEKLWTRNFVLILLANCCSSISFQLLTPTLPVYVKEYLGQTELVVGFVVGVMTLTTVLLRPFTGVLTDTWNRRNLCALGMMICAASIFFYQFAEWVLFLVLLRLLHGIGWAVVTTVNVTIASDALPRHRLGEGMGYYGLSTVFSLAVAPSFGLYLINVWSYTQLFLVTTLLLVIGAVLGLCIQGQQWSPRPKLHVNHFLTGLFERTAIKPSLVNFCVSLSFSAIMTFIALYAAQFRIENIGIFFTVFACTLLVMRPLAGRLVDAKGYKIVIIPGIFALVGSMVILYFASSLFHFLVAAVLYGIGYGVIHPSLQAMVVSRAQPEKRGAANSTFLLSSDLAFGIGAILWGAVASVTGYRVMYLLVLIPILMALYVHLFINIRHVDKKVVRDGWLKVTQHIHHD